MKCIVLSNNDNINKVMSCNMDEQIYEVIILM